MPPIVIAGAIAGAGALGGAVVSSSAAGKASKAASDAASQNAQIQQQMYQQTRGDLAPYMQTGYTAQNALLQRLGLSGGQPAASASPVTGKAGGGFAVSPATPNTGVSAPGVMAQGGASPAGMAAGGASGSPNWDQLLQDRPDVMAEYQRASSTADHNSPVFQQKGLDSPEHYAQYWYNQMGGNQSYQFPSTQTQASAQPAANGTSTIPGQTLTSADNGGLGARPTLARPDFTEAQPAIGAGPSSAQYTNPADFSTSPGYQFRLNEGLRNLNASYGAKGLLQSDAAIKGVNDYAAGSASSEYANWFNQQMSKLGADQSQFNNDRATGLAQYNQDRNVFNTNYNTDTARSDNNFNADRGYNTDQYNTYTGNLFNLAGMGANAAAGAGSAAQNYASQATANNNSLASVQGNAAIAGANGINGAINSGLQAYGMYSNPFSVGAGAQGFMNTAPAAVQSSMAGLF